MNSTNLSTPSEPPLDDAIAVSAAPQRYGVFLNVEDPHGNARDALAQTLRTGVAAEELGFDDIWVAEHHHSRFAIGSATGVLLGWLAARTTRVRLGLGAALLPLNDPVRIAEEVATLDLVSGGRVEFGVARGGPFPVQYRHAGLTNADDARERMFEALALIRRLWREPRVDFAGRFYRCADITVEPRPLQNPVPVWLASLSDAALRLAARTGDGLMVTPSADLASVAATLAPLRAAHPQRHEAHVVHEAGVAHMANVAGAAHAANMADAAHATNVAGVAHATNVAGVAHATNVAGAARVANVAGVAHVANMADAAHAANMAGAAHVANVADTARAANVAHVANMAIARFFHCETDPARAVAHGLQGVREYPRRMGVQFGPAGCPPMFRPDASDAVILDNAIIGGPAECAAQLRRLRERLGPHRLLLKPAVHDPAAARAALALFMRETVRFA